MTEEPLEPVSPLALPQHKPARARHQPRPAQKKAEQMIEPPISDEQIDRLHHRLDAFSVEFTRMNSQYAILNSKLEALRVLESDLADDPNHVPMPIQRRRTEDEMRRALRLLSSGERRPQDDESVLVMEDAIGEVFALRLAYANLMQATTTAFQNGQAAIRRMTER